ncbi:MAG: hypothetical protein COU22_03710 [Candidatus Komeilibacteria bacterium CG10_big_fil_rev_8_21_14_0_10_41_13]|uniref:DUF5673 domain-containing protein n=1 Tax=Candidatus Komeilibacteria bacterium CG10_big_fil_rev_8_21_14_0_10_41_13 TaxID=1974476 RepID=A0A2M6WBU9_9BACT|nr:MAG: hypothetical protein COU22_03710 [Candidatus Komeilibacteria bacterium CG10_big_fil_rev_8_21_14_0_10_41_13]
MASNQTDPGQTLASWSFWEYEVEPRSKLWHIMFFIIIALLLIYTLVTVNFLFAVIIIIASIVILMRAKYGPSKVTFAITDNGIMIDGDFHEYNDLRDFYFIYEPPKNQDLYINFKSLLTPRLRVPLAGQNPLALRQILSEYLDEDLEKEAEPLSEAFRKFLKL